MAKKRKRSGKRRTRRASARRRSPVRRRRTTRARRKTRGGAPFASRVRRGTRVIYINGRKRRSRRRHRRNPGYGGLLKRTLIPYATGVITSGVMAMVDVGLAKYPMVAQLVKVGSALVVTMTVGRKNPMIAAAAIGALGATQGYPLITKFAGGMVARTPAEAVKGLGEMSETYPEMGALLNGGVGALLNGVENLDTTVNNYETALQGGDHDDDY